MDARRLEEVEQILTSEGWLYDQTSNEFVFASGVAAGRIIDADDIVAFTSLSFADLDAYVAYKSGGKHRTSN